MTTQDTIEIPRLTTAERDRRYRLVRERMDREGLDALILPANVSRWEQMMADSRYITTIGGFGTETLTIFPREGEVTAYVFNRSAFWMSAQDWVTDVRDGRNHWAENAIERLGECVPKPRKRVGISGLAGLIRAPDGIIPWTTVERIKRAFPATEFVDATRLIQEVRSVKSAEEIALMRRSAAIIEAMIGAMIAAARAGVRERDVYAAMVHTLLANDGEQPSMLIFGSGPGIGARPVRSDRAARIQRGDLLVNEIEARYAGYSAQAVAPLSIGPASAAYLDLLRVARDAFEAIRAGDDAGHADRHADGRLYPHRRDRPGKGKYKWAHPMMHARGLGDESPALLSDDDLERFRRVELREGMTFIVKPRARGADGLSAQIGDTVVVTPQRRRAARQARIVPRGGGIGAGAARQSALSSTFASRRRDDVRDEGRPRLQPPIPSLDVGHVRPLDIEMEPAIGVDAERNVRHREPVVRRDSAARQAPPRADRRRRRAAAHDRRSAPPSGRRAGSGGCARARC